MSIILHTESLHLRDIEPADLMTLGRIYGDAECMQFYPGTKSSQEVEVWFQHLAFDSYERHGFGLWAVVDTTSDAVIGDCGISMQETPAGLEPGIGYHLWRDFWGQGLATEAARGCRNHALHTLGLGRVVSITSPENMPSQRVAQRVHDRRETYRKKLRSSGEWADRYLYISEAPHLERIPTPPEP